MVCPRIRTGEGARHTTPSPIVVARRTELPSPRKRGEGTVMVTELAARCRTVFGNSHLTMSNSPDRLVPAAHFCARGLPLNLRSPRTEGWAERRRAHLVS